MRPWSASGAFSAAEYEDAKRRVRRLDQAQALPALELDNKSSRLRKPGAQSAAPACVQDTSANAAAAQPNINLKQLKSGTAEGSFLTNLQSSISELAASIELKLSGNPQIRAAIGADFSELQLHVER